MDHPVRRFAVPVVSFLLGISLQIGGYHNERVAWALFAIAALWALAALVTWPPVSRQFARVPVRLTLGYGSTPAFDRKPIEVVSDGVLWIWGEARPRVDRRFGSYPILRAYCVDHRIPLQRMDSKTGEITRFLQDNDLIDDTKGIAGVAHLYCAHGDGHTFSFGSPVQYSQPHRRAQVKAEAEHKAQRHP